MDTKPNNKGFWLEEWRVEPSLGELINNDVIIQLEPKVMAVLELLASKPGEVFSRQQIEEYIWHDTIVGYDALSKAINKLREALGDDKKQPRFIQTISKKGYRLVATVRNDSPVETEYNDQPTASAPVSPLKKSRPRQLYIGISAVIVVLLITGVVLFTTSLDKPIPDKRSNISLAVEDKPTLVILPFRSISPDNKDNYLADGLTSDLITDLSKLSGLWVLASNAVQAYKDIEISPEKARQTFNARYLLSGEVNKAGNAIRINVHLTDTEQGKILWASRYDRQFTDLFAIQDEVTQQIVQNLSLTLTQEEQRRIAQRYTHNLQAYEYFLRGRTLVNIRTPENNSTSREMYKKAIELDPGFARAYAGLAMTYSIGFVRQWPADVNDPLQEALKLSERAIVLDKELPESYWVASLVNSNQGDFEKAMQFLYEALKLNPNYADAYAMLAWIKVSIGKPGTALDYMKKAFHLNPTGGSLYMIQAGKAHYFMGNYEQAYSYLEKARNNNPLVLDSIFYSMVNLARLNRYDDASWLLQTLKQNHPELDLVSWIENLNAVTKKEYKLKLLSDLREIEAYSSANSR